MASVQSRSSETTVAVPIDEKTEIPAAALAPADMEKAKSAPPVDGTRDGWLTVFGGFMGLFGSFGFLNAIGIFQTYYQETLLIHYTPSQISWIFSIQLFLMFACGILWGRLVDSYGPRIILVCCSILAVFALCMLSLSTQFYQIFLTQGILFGIGASGIVFPCTVVTNHWFTKRRGLALGIVASGSCVGGVVFPLFLNYVFAKYGFHGSVRYCALFVGLSYCFAVALVKPRTKPAGWNKQAAWFDFAAFKEPAFVLYCVAGFFIMLAMFAPFNYLPTMAKRHGFSNQMALYTISIVNAGSTPGRILPAFVADYIGRFNIIVVVGICSGISILAFWLPMEYYPSHAGILTFGCLYGFLSGAYISLQSPCIVELSTGKMHLLGQRVGIFFGVMSLGALIGLPVQGSLIVKYDGGFTGLMVFSGVCFMVGGFALAASRIIHGGRTIWKKV